MLRRRALHGALAAALAAAALAGPSSSTTAASGRAPKPKRITVADFYYAPNAVTIRRGGVVKWIWAATNVEPHDVHLKKGPKGLKKRASYSTRTTAVTNAVFKHAFPTPGTYRFICTIHPTQMRMTVTVKR